MCKSHGPIPIGAWCWRVRKVAVANHVHPFLHAPGDGIQLLLLLVAVVFGPVSAAAQVGCIPNTPNYPCVYVADSGDSTVSVINATTQNVITMIAGIGPSPTGVAVTPNNAFVYVTTVNTPVSQVAVIDTRTNTLTTSVSLHSLNGVPSQIAITPDGAFAYVVESSTIEVIDTATNLAVSVVNGVTSPTAIAFTPDGKFAYIADTCPRNACAQVVDTSTQLVTTTIQIPDTLVSEPASIAVTPDGSTVCMSVGDPNHQFEVAFINASSNTLLVAVPLEQLALASNLGFGITPGGILYAAASTDPITGNPLNTVIPVNTISQVAGAPINVGLGPTGVAVAAGGAFVYVTNANSDTVSVIDTTNDTVIATVAVAGKTPQGVAAMPSIPPTITTQPASQTVNFGQGATLSVVATGTVPLAYQWYAGMSGDVTKPFATGPSISFGVLTSSPGSFWVQASNLAGSANSNTATITVNPAPPPTITTQPASQTINPGQTATLTFAAITPPPLSYNAQWYQGQSGDTSTPVAGAVGNSFTTPALASTTSYWVQATDIAGSANSNTATITVIQPPQTVSPGQSVDVGVLVNSPTGSPVEVGFACTIVTSQADQNPRLASDLGITCHSNPPTITLSKAPQSVTIMISTTGSASGALAPRTRNPTWFYALWLPLLAMAFFGEGFSTLCSRCGDVSQYVALAALVVLLLLLTSCGGGFTAPNVAATPAGSYKLTIVDYPIQGQTSGFVQTLLIVPLTVT